MNTKGFPSRVFMVSFFTFQICLCIFGCAGSLLLHSGFICSESGLLSSCGAGASHRGGFSCWGAQTLGAWASVVVALGLSCSAACGILLGQGSNLCPPHWQVDS